VMRPQWVAILRSLAYFALLFALLQGAATTIWLWLERDLEREAITHGFTDLQHLRDRGPSDIAYADSLLMIRIQSGSEIRQEHDVDSVATALGFSEPWQMIREHVRASDAARRVEWGERRRETRLLLSSDHKNNQIAACLSVMAFAGTCLLFLAGRRP
jgi:hypothetical protein